MILKSHYLIITNDWKAIHLLKNVGTLRAVHHFAGLLSRIVIIQCLMHTALWMRRNAWRRAFVKGGVIVWRVFLKEICSGQTVKMKEEKKKKEKKKKKALTSTIQMNECRLDWWFKGLVHPKMKILSLITRHRHWQSKKTISVNHYP